MRKRRKWILFILGCFVVLWITQAVIVSANIKRISGFIKDKSGDILSGNLVTGNIETSYFETFPFLSVRVDDISITDSLFARHNEELFRSDYAFIRINPFLLIRGNPVDRIIFKNGRLFSHTDSTGYSNRTALKLKERNAGERKSIKNGERRFPALILKNFVLHFDNPSKNNFYEFNVKKLKAEVEQQADGIFKIALHTKARINRLTVPGSLGDYLYHKNINASIGFELSRGEKLNFSEASINVEGSPLLFDGNFYFDREKPRFNIRIKADKLPYEEAVSFLPDSVKNKFDAYYFNKPLNFQVDIQGINDFKSKPLLELVITTSKNKIISPYGIFSDCSFRFLFHNQFLPGTENRNSAVIITGLTGRLKGLPVKADSITITGIKDPFLDLSFLQQSY